MYILPPPVPTYKEEIRFLNISLMEMVHDKTLNEKDVFGLSLYLSKLIDELEVSQ